MSQAKGAAYGSFGEISGAAVGNSEIAGMAIGDNIAWELGAEIFEVLYYPEQVIVNETFDIEILCNRKTEYAVTYAVVGTSQNGIVREINDKYDTEDGKRVISIGLKIGTAGTRTIRIYGATQQTNAAQHQSLTYKDITVVIRPA